MSRSPSPVIQRASRTYGRRRNPDPDTSFEIANISMSSCDDPDSSMSLSVDHQFPPTSDDVDATNASPASEHASKTSDDDDDESPGDGDSRYQWSWFKGLKAIDNGDFDDKMDLSGQTPLNDTAGSSTRPVSPSDRDREASSVFGGPLSSLPSSSRSPSTFTRPRESNTLPASDPESDTRPSSPESSPPHLLGTPQSQLPPTPPTSIEMPPTKGKGKERATVHPLRFDNDEQSMSSSKPLKQTTTQTRKPKGSTSGAKRVRAPTKKEREETTKATARIAANQHASIVPVHNVRELSILSLQRRVSSAASAIPQVVGKRLRSSSPIQSSDPIQTSSPRAEDHSLQRARTSTSRASAGTSFVSNGLLAEINLDSGDSSGSEDMPDFEDLRKAEQKKRSLQEFKQRLVQTAQPVVDGDDSDLEIVDNQKSVAQDVAQSRRGMMARGEFPTAGTKKQLAAAGPSARRKSAPLLVNNTTDLRRTLRAAAVPAFHAKKKGAPIPQLTHSDLNRMLWSKAEEISLQAIRQKEEEWQRHGGEIKQQPGPDAAATGLPSLSEIVHQRREALEKKHAVLDVDDDSGSDQEWKPEGDNENDGAERDGSDSDREEPRCNSAALDPDDQADDEDDEDDDEENVFLVKRPLVRPPRARQFVAIESDDEDDAENRPPPQSNRGRTLVRDASWANAAVPAEVVDTHAVAHRDSISSLGETTDSTRTEDGTDKENDARLSYPRGDDKENTAVAVQTPVSPVSMRLNRSFGSLFAEKLTSPSGSVGRGAGPSSVRSPLQELPADDDDDPFGPPVQLAGPSGLSPEPTLDLGEGCGLQPAFSLSVKGKGKERARSSSPSSLGDALDLGGGIGGGGGFSQFVTQEGIARGFDQLKAAQVDDDIPLTADIGLQPALDISSTFRKKADEIFEKEQEHIAQQELSHIQNDSAPEMFVDENGFLTQTRPQFVSPLRMRSPTQFTSSSARFSSPGSLLMSSTRKPLAPLPSQDPDDDDLPVRRRLRKRLDDEPLPDLVLPPATKMAKMRNAFDVLGKPPKGKKKFERSEFIQGEAEESDEDVGFGFGLSKKVEDEDEDDGDDQDQVVSELVDDKTMDEETLAEEAVIEKHREQMEELDKDNEKLHRDAVTGKLRIKRRDRGVGLDSSDSEDDDERARELRAKRKKVNVNNDSITALAKNQDTQAFAKEYTASMDDDETEFAHLRTEHMEVDGGVDVGVEDTDDEMVSAAQLEKELRMAARMNDYAAEFDVNNLRYLEQDDEEMEEPRVREVSNEVLATRRSNAGPSAQKQTTGDAVPQSWARWAKTESSSRTAGVVGRNTGGSAAVTGHGKKAAAGSFKASRTAASSSSASAKSARLLAKMPSLLSTVSNRQAKFGNK